MATLLRPRVCCGCAPCNRTIDPDGQGGEPAGLFVERRPQLRDRLRQRDLEGDGAGPAAGLGRTGVAARRLGGARARTGRAWLGRCGRSARRARHDVHVLRRTRRGGFARASGVARRSRRLLARQFGAEPGDPDIHGLCARVELGRSSPGAGRVDGLRARLSGEPDDRYRGGQRCRSAPCRRRRPMANRRVALRAGSRSSRG